MEHITYYIRQLRDDVLGLNQEESRIVGQEKETTMNSTYIHDPIEDDLNRFLSEVADEEARECHIQHHIDILLHQHGEMYPFRTDNLGEALANLTDQEVAVLGDVLSGREWELVGSMLTKFVSGYWEKAARVRTMADMASGRGIEE